MKKTIAFLLALFMILGLFAGCKGGENTDESESGGEAQKTLTVGIPQSSTIESYTRGNGFTEYLEEKTGIKIKFYYFSNSPGEYRQQLALMCSANQKLPDVIVGLNLGHYVMNQYGEDGYFLDLTDLIEEYAPNYKKALAELKEKAPDVAEYASEKVKNAENGATYGMPRIMPIATDSLQSLMHINKTWLDKLGLEPPKTVEELRTVLQAFKDNDCNGNGAHDEIALFGTSGTAAYIINAFVYYQSGCFNVTDGEVWDPVRRSRTSSARWTDRPRSVCSADFPPSGRTRIRTRSASFRSFPHWKTPPEREDTWSLKSSRSTGQGILRKTARIPNSRCSSSMLSTMTKRSPASVMAWRAKTGFIMRTATTVPARDRP